MCLACADYRTIGGVSGPLVIVESVKVVSVCAMSGFILLTFVTFVYSQSLLFSLHCMAVA